MQIRIITVEKGNVDMVAGVDTESYPDVFDGELPGIGTKWSLNPSFADGKYKYPGFETKIEN